MSPIGRLTRATLVLLAALAALGTLGCGGGLAVTKLSAAQGAPSNLAFLMAVERDGKPVTGLTPDAFTVTEDGVLLSKDDAQLSLQPVAVGAVTETLILVDRSSDGAAAVPADELVAAVEGLAERAGKLGKVAIYAFDGDEEIHAIVPFTDDTTRAKVADLADYEPKDGSSNLHGAVLRGVDALERSLAKEATPIHFGALVVVAAGPDRAARKSADDVASALEDGKHVGLEVFTIGVGPAASEARLDRIGRAGSRQTGPTLTLAAAADRTALDLESRWRRYYLVSFCTPARKGEHKVRIEVHGGTASGAFEHTFVADGMGAGCDTNAPPKLAALDAPKESGGRLGAALTNAVAVAPEVSSASAARIARAAVPAKLEARGAPELDPAPADDDDPDDASADDGSGKASKLKAPKEKSRAKKKGDGDKKTDEKKGAEKKKEAKPAKPAPKPSGKKK